MNSFAVPRMTDQLTLTRRNVVFLSLGAALALDLPWPQTLIVFGGASLLGIWLLRFCDWLNSIGRRRVRAPRMDATRYGGTAAYWRAQEHPERAPVPAVDPSRSTPNA